MLAGLIIGGAEHIGHISDLGGAAGGLMVAGR